jgi:tetratricopeptide (TPR) repeat protein
LSYEVFYNLMGLGRAGGQFLYGDTSDVLELTNHALKLDPNNWKAHVILGALYSAQWEWVKASNSFDMAMAINPLGVTSNVWYAVFLLAIGEQQKALRIVETMARHYPSNFNAQLMSGLFLYVTRQHERAIPALQAALSIDLDHWASWFLFALNDLALGKLTAAQDKFRDLTEMLLEAEGCEHIFSGFTFYINILEGGFDQASDSYSLFKNGPIPNRMDKAMFGMALQMNVDAVIELEILRARKCPIVCWLHLWPLFDPLRGTPDFKRLIAEMNLPSPHS